MSALWKIPHVQPEFDTPLLLQSLAEALSASRPKDLNERQWLLQSGVSTSFFTDLRKGVVPGVDKLGKLAQRARLSLSDLLNGVASPPATRLPNEEELALMLAAAQNEVKIPEGLTIGGYPQAVASGLRARLLLFAGEPANAPAVAELPKTAPAEKPQSARSTKRAAKG